MLKNKQTKKLWVSANNLLKAGTVPGNNFLKAGTVSANNHIHYLNHNKIQYKYD